MLRISPDTANRDQKLAVDRSAGYDSSPTVLSIQRGFIICLPTGDDTIRSLCGALPADRAFPKAYEEQLYLWKGHRSVPMLRGFCNRPLTPDGFISRFVGSRHLVDAILAHLVRKFSFGSAPQNFAEAPVSVSMLFGPVPLSSNPGRPNIADS